MPEAIASVRIRERTVPGRLNYIGPMTDRPRYYADDCSRDVLTLDPRTIEVEDARLRTQPHSLAQAGFALLPHVSAVSDFRDPDEITRVYRLETERLLLDLTGADDVVLSARPVRRFAHGSPDSIRLTNSGRIYNSRPAHFVHVDISNAAAAEFAQRGRPKDQGRPVRRFRGRATPAGAVPGGAPPRFVPFRGAHRPGPPAREWALTLL